MSGLQETICTARDPGSTRQLILKELKELVGKGVCRALTAAEFLPLQPGASIELSSLMYVDGSAILPQFYSLQVQSIPAASPDSPVPLLRPTDQGLVVSLLFFDLIKR